MWRTKLKARAVTVGRWLRSRNTRLPSAAVSSIAAKGKAGITISRVLMSNMENNVESKVSSPSGRGLA